MAANRLLNAILTATAWIVVPVQLVTTSVLGILVSVSFGLLLWPISVVWAVLLGPMLGISWLCKRCEPLRVPLGVVFLPWAVMANVFVCVMPSMGELEIRAAKLMLTNAWPFSWEMWLFQTGRLDLYSSEALPLLEVVGRISRNDALMQRTIDRIAMGEQLDPKP